MGDFIATAIGLFPSRALNPGPAQTQDAAKLTSGRVRPSFPQWNSTAPTNETCWDQWLDYWSSSALVATQYASGCVTTATTVNTTTSTRASISQSIVTFTHSTEYITNGVFTVSTVLPSESLGTQTNPSQAAETATLTDTFYFSSCSYRPDVATITKPPCILPSVVPQCQRSWTDYISLELGRFDLTAPACTGTGSACQASFSVWDQSDDDYWSSSSSMSPTCSQASIGTQMCSALQSSYVRDFGTVEPVPGVSYNTPVVMSHGYQASLTTYANGSWDRNWVWNTTWSLAPKCSLGCARCAVTGGTVQVLYWPTMSATTPILAKTMNTTLTYPTVSPLPYFLVACPLLTFSSSTCPFSQYTHLILVAVLVRPFAILLCP